MRNNEKIIEKINPKDRYSAMQIFNNKFFGKITYYRVRNIINQEMFLPEYERCLDIIKLGKGNGTTYYVLGSSIIKYLKNN